MGYNFWLQVDTVKMSQARSIFIEKPLFSNNDSDRRVVADDIYDVTREKVEVYIPTYTEGIPYVCLVQPNQGRYQVHYQEGWGYAYVWYVPGRCVGKRSSGMKNVLATKRSFMDHGTDFL